MSAFETLFRDGGYDPMAEVLGETITYVDADQTSTSITAIVVEDVGATDPFVERTFVIATDALVATPTNGDRITANSQTWVVIKVRTAADGTYEVRTRAPEQYT